GFAEPVLDEQRRGIDIGVVRAAIRVAEELTARCIERLAEIRRHATIPNTLIVEVFVADRDRRVVAEVQCPGRVEAPPLVITAVPEAAAILPDGRHADG